ncbi:MAG: hypothetical protein H7835_11555 [Magnetococcus sp. XQGC-1]
MDHDAIQDIEIRLLLEALYERYGYDFRNYAMASLKRRIVHCLSECQFRHVSEIIPRLLYEGMFLKRLIQALTVSVTEMFRDPPVYRILRQQVIPVLRTRPFFNVWHAGCATGEEAYSFAILLQEESLLERARIFVTDLDEEAIHVAREGIYPLEKVKTYTKNYQESGGTAAFSDYYHARYDRVRMDPELKKSMVFATNNLATDAVFAETQLIFCRNVLIYFAPALQNRVLDLFRESLTEGGFLCLGSQESLQFSGVAEQFTVVAPQERIYRKRDVKGKGGVVC